MSFYDMLLMLCSSDGRITHCYCEGHWFESSQGSYHYLREIVLLSCFIGNILGALQCSFIINLIDPRSAQSKNTLVILGCWILSRETKLSGLTSVEIVKSTHKLELSK